MSTILLAVALQHWERPHTHALAARDVAAALARCPAHLLHVLSVYAYPSIDTYGLPLGLASRYRDEQMYGIDVSLRQKMRAYITPLEAAGIRVSTLLRVGQPRQTIVQVAQEIGADLLIMGTHSKRRLWHIALGGTAQRIGKYATCPVLLVSPPRGGAVAPGDPAMEEPACQLVRG
jgi:nucleotide-binding universal stress UspA family protein